MGLKTGPPTPQEVLTKHTTHKTICVWLGVCGLHPTQCLSFPSPVQPWPEPFCKELKGLLPREGSSCEFSRCVLFSWCLPV